jgi:glutathione S-transferase
VRIWEIPHSTNAERVCLALAHKGLAVEHVVVPDEDRGEVVRVSGQELVPVLETDDGEILHDSPAILRWLEERHPEPPLWPAGERARAEADVFLDWFNLVWKRAPNLIHAEEQRPVPGDAPIARWAERLRASLDVFEGLLEGRDYLLGDDFGIADVTAFPFLKYPALGVPADDEHRFHAILVETMPTADHPRLVAWAHRCDTRPRA